MTSLLPRYIWSQNSKRGVFEKAVDTPKGYERVDNITDRALQLFQTHYEDTDIDKDAIFFYVYGILHHPNYLLDHKDSLEAELPRIPLAPNFTKVRDLGYRLARLHLAWSDLDGYDLEKQTSLVFDPSNPEHYKFTNIKWEDPPPKLKSGQATTSTNTKSCKTALRINHHLTLAGIPAEAHKYELNGLSPLDWIEKQYVVRQDYVDLQKSKIKTSRSGKLYNANGQETKDRTQAVGIINDPNFLFSEPDGIVKLIERVTQMSVETAELISKLEKETYDDGKAVPGILDGDGTLL